MGGTPEDKSLKDGRLSDALEQFKSRYLDDCGQLDRLLLEEKEFDLAIRQELEVARNQAIERLRQGLREEIGPKFRRLIERQLDLAVDRLKESLELEIESRSNRLGQEATARLRQEATDWVERTAAVINPIRADGEDAEIALYEGSWSHWKRHPRGAIVAMGPELILCQPGRGQRVLASLSNGIWTPNTWWSHPNGIIGWTSRDGQNVFSLFGLDGTQTLIANDNNMTDWTAYGHPRGLVQWGWQDGLLTVYLHQIGESQDPKPPIVKNGRADRLILHPDGVVLLQNGLWMLFTPDGSLGRPIDPADIPDWLACPLGRVVPQPGKLVLIPHRRVSRPNSRDPNDRRTPCKP